MREYLDLVERVLTRGTLKKNRTGIDTISCFAEHYRVDLQNGYPLLTTKRVNFNSMLYEVLWYLSGEDHIRNLQKHTRLGRMGGRERPSGNRLWPVLAPLPQRTDQSGDRKI